MVESSNCRHPEQHHQHLCVLSARLGKADLAPLLRSPRYVCSNCGGRTREGKNLCQPIKIRT